MKDSSKNFLRKGIISFYTPIEHRPFILACQEYGEQMYGGLSGMIVESLKSEIARQTGPQKEQFTAILSKILERDNKILEDL